jgi:hypothetical protein
MKALALLEKCQILHNELHFENITLICDEKKTDENKRYMVKIFDWDRGVAPNIAERYLPSAHTKSFVIGYDLIGFRNSLESHNMFPELLFKAFPIIKGFGFRV